MAPDAPTPDPSPADMVAIPDDQPDRCPTVEDVVRVADAFQMPAYDEDNHGPGISRTLFCPVDPRYRTACECKTDETLHVEPDGYAWTTPTDGPCTGCYYETLFHMPCPIHHKE